MAVPETAVTTATANLTFEATFRDEAELRHVYERELVHGGYFLRGAEALDERERCRLVLVHPAGRRFELLAEAVWISADGVGLQLLDFEEEVKRGLHAFIDDAGPVEREVHEPNPYLRLRGLSLAEQLRRARGPDVQERIALERIYGKSVWEALLGNPRLSVAEVGRIARKGTLPQPLIDQIASNDGWLSSPEVRRALLSNPRLRGRSLRRVLALLPKAELKLIDQQTGYPAQVRAEAARLVKT